MLLLIIAVRVPEIAIGRIQNLHQQKALQIDHVDFHATTRIIFIYSLKQQSE